MIYDENMMLHILVYAICAIIVISVIRCCTETVEKPLSDTPWLALSIAGLILFPWIALVAQIIYEAV